MNNIQYYTNRQEYQGCKIPTREPNFFKINNHLAELSSPDDKKEARYNLGISEIIENLDNKIDNKVINENDISWDIKPTQGNTDKVLSSHAIYQTLLNYISKEKLDSDIQKLWTNIINKISDNYNKIEIELNQLYEDLENCINKLQQHFNNQAFDYEQKQTKLREDYQDLLNHFAELKAFVRDEYINLYQTLYCNIDRDQIFPLEQKINDLSLLVESFLKTSGGIALANQFGSSEYIGINQKTLTIALNEIWEKIESMTGELGNGINMIVSPSYFIGDSGTVNVSATPCQDRQVFEHIAFYINGTLIQETDNIRDFNFSTQIEETSELKCVAKILGIEYETSKIIKQYSGKFFLFSGNFNTTNQIVSYAMNHPEFTISLENGLRITQDVTCQDNDKIFILIEGSLENKFIRADLNGLEIPFEQETITINEVEYKLLTSTNSYNAGVYNIDING